MTYKITLYLTYIEVDGKLYFAHLGNAFWSYKILHIALCFEIIACSYNFSKHIAGTVLFHH